MVSPAVFERLIIFKIQPMGSGSSCSTGLSLFNKVVTSMKGEYDPGPDQCLIAL